MAKDGLITRKDLIEDQALNLGSDYAKNMQQAIDANKDFISSLKEMAQLVNAYRNVSNQKEYIALKEIENKVVSKSNDVWKEQNALELALLSTKKKNELATEGTNRALIKERTVLAETNAEIKRQTIANGALESAYKKLSAQVGIAGDKLKNIIATGKLASESQAQYNKRLQVAQSEFDKLNVRVRSADAAVGQFNRNVGNYPTKAVEGLKNLISAFGVLTGIQLFVSVMKDAFTITRDFEKEIVNLAAIAGQSREEIAPLESKIREVSKASINGATDVAKLATELIKLGSTTEEAAKLIEPVNNLSVALQASAEDSATLVKSILNSYNLGAEEATRVTDVLAESANRSALDFQGLRDSFSYLAPSARALGISVEKTASLIGILADNGIKAESAGRLTSTAFARLANQGLTLEDALKKINDAQKEGKSNLEVLALASNIFGAEAGKIGLILANNTEKIESNTIAYQNSGGALKELTDKQLKSLDSQLKILSSAWEDYVLNTDAASGSSSKISSITGFLANNLSTILDVIGYATAAWIVYKGVILLASVQQKLLDINLRLTTASQTQNIVATEAGAVAQVANAEATTIATTAWQRFNLALKANALGLIVAGLIAAIYYFNKFNVSLSETVGETKKATDEFLKSRNAISKNNDSIKILSDRYDELKSKTTLTKEEQKELNAIIQTLAKTVPGAVTAVNKYGDAIAINTTKTRAFVEAQKEVVKLETSIKIKENTEALKQLRKEQDDLNFSKKNYQTISIEGLSGITKENGVLKIYNEYLGTRRNLTQEELLLFKKTVLANEQNIAQTEANIKSLKGLNSEKKASIKTEQEKVKNQAANAPRTIEIIDAEIAAQKELIKSLSDKTGKEGNAIKAKIKNLEAEKELIFSTDKADKKATIDHLKRITNVKDALYNLSQFRYENEIGLNQKIIDSDKSTTEAKLNALYDIEQLRQSKNEETLQKELVNNALSKEGLDKLSKSKLDIYVKDAENRAKSILDGSISIDKLTTEETLIYEKYYANVKNLRDKDNEDKQKIIDNEVDLLQKNIDKEKLARDTKLQDDLLAEENTFKTELQLAGDNYALLEKAKLDHENRMSGIISNAKKDQLNIEIDAIQELLNAEKLRTDGSAISIDKIKKLENELATLRKELNVENNNDTVKTTTNRVELEKEAKDRITDLQLQLKDVLVDLTNTIFDARISNIDNEINKNNEYYDKQIELAGNDERQKSLLEKERAKKEEELQKKKKKEELKAAIFSKAMAVITIGIQTAMASVAALAPPPVGLGPLLGPSLLPYIIGLGAIQAATVIAAPLPKYKMGRKGGPEELAVTGDGGVPEVVSRPDGSGALVTPNKPTLTYLQKDDIVHKSVADYNEYMRRSILKGFYKERQQAHNYQVHFSGNSVDNTKELHEIKEAIKRQKTHVTVTNKIDIGYELWRASNINWRR